jgi:hypothetical protein
VRYFICNTPSAYAVISVLHRPVESAGESGLRIPIVTWCRRRDAIKDFLVPAGTYRVALSKSASDPVLTAEARLNKRRFGQ